MEREVELVPPVVKIGRDERSHLRLEADGVQRFHSVLELDGAELTLVDLGTLEGTALNGHKVHRAVVKAGDRITIGGFTLAVRTRS
jgi:pSer/pThr/pTyr-binding forkhead associated (FHA) protein